MFFERDKPCDTDLFMLSLTNGNQIKNYDETRSILHKSLKEAVKYKDFDFDISTLRMYKTERKDNYLLLHIQVYGGAKGVEASIRYLQEADKIITEAMKSVLNSFEIKMDVLFKQYIFYSQNLNDFERFMQSKFPDFQIRKLYDSKIYLGDIVIAATKKTREMTHKLGYLAFEIAEEILGASIKEREDLEFLADKVITRIRMVGPLYRAEIKRKYKKSIYQTLFIEMALIASFSLFIYYYYYLYLGYIIGLIMLILVLISVIGMTGVYLAKVSLEETDFVLK